MKRLLLLAVPLLVAGCPGPEAERGEPAPSPSPEVVDATPMPALDVLGRVRERERLICGVSANLPGFSIQEGDAWNGFYVDFCRAIAAAVLGNPGAVQFRVVAPTDRFAAVQRNDVDVLLLPTPYSLTRDAIPHIGFAPPIFHDHQAVMVRQPKPSKPTPKAPAQRPIQRLADLNKRSICVESGISSRVLQSYLTQAKVAASLQTAPDLAAVLNQYEKGTCDAISADLSQLLAWRSRQPQKQEHTLLPDRLSWEPLSPVVHSGDDRWRTIITWVVFSTIRAEELGITRQNHGALRSRPDPEVGRFLGTQDSLGIELGLDPDWTTQILDSVGNYGEIFERHLTPLGIPRAENRLRRNGGRMESMPFR